MNEIINFDLYDNDFKWDYKLHFPIPTLDYIKRRTGDSLSNNFDTLLEAEGAVIAVVRSAKNYLFSGRLDMKAWEFHMSRDIDLLYEVLEYLLEVINFAFVSGDYIEFFRVLDGKTESPALKNAKNSLLGARKTIPYGAKIREGY